MLECVRHHSVRKWKYVMRFEIIYFFLEIGLNVMGLTISGKKYKSQTSLYTFAFHRLACATIHCVRYVRLGAQIHVLFFHTFQNAHYWRLGGWGLVPSESLNIKLPIPGYLGYWHVLTFHHLWLRWKKFHCIFIWTEMQIIDGRLYMLIGHAFSFWECRTKWAP